MQFFALEIKNKGFSMRDFLGAILSGLCIVHCIFLPLFASIFSSSIILLQSELYHAVLVAMVLVVSMPLLIFKGNLKIGGFGLAGFIFLISALHTNEEFSEKFLTLGGSVILIMAHFMRYKLCQNKACRRHFAKKRHLIQN